MSGFRRGSRFCTGGQETAPVYLQLLVAVLLCIGFFRIVSFRLTPAIEDAAISRAADVILSEIETAVNECLSAENMTYTSFIRFDTDGNGALLALTGRPAESGRFKTLATNQITSDLENIPSELLEIHWGDLTDIMLLSGYGPDIRVRMHSVKEIAATYSSSFTAAGVNRTHHGIYLDITATVLLRIPWKIVPVVVTKQVCVAETVILGIVPDAYTYPEKGE